MKATENKLTMLWLVVYNIGLFGTFIKLTFFDGYAYNAWNWLIVVPLNFMLSAVWPIYWLIVRWLF